MKNIRISLATLKRLVKSPASGSKSFIWDVEVPGFGAYLTSSSRVSFVYQYRMPGASARRALLGYLGELTVDQARALAKDFAYKRRHGVDPVEEARAEAREDQANRELIFSVYAAEYIERRAISDTPLGKDQAMIITDRIVPFFGDERIDRITVDGVEKFAKQMAAISLSAHRGGLVYLKVLFNDAIKREKISSSPASKVPTPATEERERVLRRDEIQLVLEAAAELRSIQGDTISALMRLMKRKSEVSDIPWEEVDQSTWTWNLPGWRTKNGDPATIMLPRQVVEIFTRQQPDPERRTGYIFTTNGRSPIQISAAVKDAIDAHMHRRLEISNRDNKASLSVAHFTVHDFRTGAATILQGHPHLVSGEVIDAILLHRRAGKVTRTYQRNKYIPEAGEALQKWNDYLDEIMECSDAWPGGKDLPKLSKKQIQERIKIFRKGWPKRADQKPDDSNGK